MTHIGDQIIESFFITGHFKPDIEAFCHPEICLNFGDFFVGDVDGAGGTQFFGEGEAFGV